MKVRNLAIFVLLSVLSIPCGARAATYYVAPKGSDGESGSESHPWKSFQKAAQVAAAGDTVFFEDGRYDETSATKFAHSGTSTHPIVFRARNPRQAVISYVGRLNQQKLIIESGREYIVIADFEITQDADRTLGNNSDFLVHVEAHNTVIRGNKIHNAFEDLIKVSGNGPGGTSNVLIEGNILFDSEREGIDMVRVRSSTIRHNHISNVKRVGIMCKGGIRSVLIHGNRVHTSTPNNNQGITIGGSTDARWSYDPHGYEAYDSHGWSNLVTGPWGGALSLRGAKDSSFFNNTIVGAQTALITQKGGKTSGAIGVLRWYWTEAGPVPPGQDASPDIITGSPLNNNVSFRNNVVVAGDTKDAYATRFPADSLIGSGLNADYNLYYGFADSGPGQRLVRAGGADKGREPNGIYGESPRFVDGFDDLRLRSGSPAVDSGFPIDRLIGFFGEILDTSTDFDGHRRGEAWERGAFAFLPER